MTAEEIIAEVRSIAEALAIRDGHPGEVSNSMQYWVNDFLNKIPFQPWFEKGRQYLKTQGTAKFDGRDVTIPVMKELWGIPAIIDDNSVRYCNAINHHLNVVNWERFKNHEKTPQYHNWTPEVAEAAIRNAAQELPELCDRLEATKTAAVKLIRNPPEGEIRYSRFRPIAEWLNVLKQLGDDISDDTFRRRRAGEAVPKYRVNPESKRGSISIAMDDLPPDYTDSLKTR